jgi:hypothetical protein
MLDEFHHGAKVEAASISGITSKNAKREESLDTYAPLECTEAGETFLGMAKMFSGIGSVR